jgi:hypothetical protein
MPSSQPPDVRLSGWKEIAAHFGKSVRTVQRWEAELGLPVHRIGTGRGDTIYAVTDELDSWRQRMETRPPSEGWDPDRAPDTPQPSVAVEPKRVPWRAAAAFVVVLVAALAGAAWLWPWKDAGQPATGRVEGDRLDIYDAGGVRLWSHQYAYRVSGNLNSEGDGTKLGPWTILTMADLDGDGLREVAVTLTTTTPTRGNELIVFGPTGHVRFRRRLTDTVQFGDTRYAPPWIARGVIVTEGAGRAHLWTIWIHSGGDFPSVAERVSPTGTVEARYWSPGYIEFLDEVTIAGRPAVIVGAANNEHKGGSLAVFDASVVQGAIPAASREKTCADCPAGRPRAFLVFPRLDTVWSVGGTSPVYRVTTQESSAIRVWVSQSPDHRISAAVAYDLDASLRPVRATFGDSIPMAHQFVERLGILDHPFGDRDRAAVWPVLVWDGGGFRPVTGDGPR